MAKTLSESAAEILKASMNKAKEPAAKLNGETEDLGGATIEKPEGSAIGAAAAAKIGKAPVPGADGAKQEPLKKGAGTAAKVVADGGKMAEETEASSEEIVAEVAAEESSEEVVEATSSQETRRRRC
jgi:hypothetical protein